MPRLQELGDKLAIALSSLCVVHCLITPILLIALPALSSVAFLDHESFHQILLFFVVPVGVIALLAGYRHHRDNKVLALGMTGLAMLIIAGTIAHDFLGDSGETIMTIAASLLIVFAHIENFRKRNVCRDHQH